MKPETDLSLDDTTAETIVGGAGKRTKKHPANAQTAMKTVLVQAAPLPAVDDSQAYDPASDPANDVDC